MLTTYLTILAGLLVVYLYRKMNFWRNRGVPQLTQWSPIGDVWDVGTRYSILEKLDLMYKKFKNQASAFGFYTVTAPGLIVTDVKALKNIFIKDFNNFVDRGFASNSDDDPLSAHLLALEGEEWKNMRNSITPTLTSGKIKGMFHIIEEKTRDLVGFMAKHAHDRDGIYIKDAINRYTADVISSVAFGLESKALFEENAEILNILKDITEPPPWQFPRILFIFNFPKVARLFKMKIFSQKVEDFFVRTIEGALKYRQENNIQRPDFFNMLINLKNHGHVNNNGPVNEKGKITFNNMLAQTFIFFFGGYETTANVVSWALYYLSKDQKMQQRLREEVREVKARRGVIDYEAISEMPYLNKVFNEALRLHPAVPIIIRKSANDYKLEGSDIVVPKGVQIQIPVYSIHRDAEHFPNPEKFDPERFSPEEEAKRHPYSFIPFGEGPRNCIGMRFAQLQGRYSLATLIENFELTLNRKTKEPVRMEIATLQPRGGFWINFKKIEVSS